MIRTLRRLSVRRASWMLAATLAAAGCSTGLPRVDTARFGKPILGTSPRSNWYGSSIDLKTYWGDQDIAVYVSACLPEDWRGPGDGAWHVEATNAEGKPIPFLGVLDTRRDVSGKESTTVVPAINVGELQDCLYLVIDPNVTLKEGRITTVRPVAVLFEAHDGSWTPLRVEIALIPEQSSELTPMPEAVVTPALAE